MLGLQALVWVALTLASGALLHFAGLPWADSLRIASSSWLPWAVLTPLAFWLANRFPIERGRLWRSLPMHALGAAACVVFIFWVTDLVGLGRRPPRPSDRDRFFHRAIPTAGAAIATEPSAAPGSAAATAEAGPGSSGQPPEFTARFDHELPPGGPPNPPPFDPRPPDFRRGTRVRMGGPLIGFNLPRANFNGAIYLMIVIAAHALAFYRRAQDRERHAATLAAGLNQAKLEALRLQLQPHFLFNTLNAISTLVHRDAAAADDLIGDLSDLLRLSLQTTDHEVPLARELELLDRYLAIETTRLGDRLRLVREIDPATVNGYVPTFVLQPLVENAIRHGIEPRLAPGTVTLRARVNGSTLELSVIDDGVGLDRPPTSSAPRRGIGITNTEARLRALHGTAAQLQVRARPDNGGVEVVVTLPYSASPRPAVDTVLPADFPPRANPSP